ncbi:MAG TPA: VOC family protein [Myxococcota bacterium]|nr:VOC family protein [Myxococcota bacterium]
MIQANGIHHVAFSTADIKRQIEFFSDVLGLPLVALFPMHGVPGGLHGFLEASPRCLISFVQLEANAKIEIEYGRTHAGNGASPSAPGTLQHLALNVDSDEQLLALRNRIRSRGVNVLGPIDHGMCRSIYFAGPEALTLEIATSSESIDPETWIDPETVRRAGIREEELERFRRPASYESPSEPVPQPEMDPEKPHMRYPRKLYAQLLSMPDEAIGQSASEPEPPVKPRPRSDRSDAR